MFLKHKIDEIYSQRFFNFRTIQNLVKCIQNFRELFLESEFLIFGFCPSPYQISFSNCIAMTERVMRLEQEVKKLHTQLAILKHNASHLTVYDEGDSNYKRQPVGKNQEQYINHLEEQIKRTRLKYQEQIGEVKIKASELEQKLHKVHEDMSCITAKAKQIDAMQSNIDILKSKLVRRDRTIARYNEQYSKFLDMVKNFQTQRANGKPIETQTTTAPTLPQRKLSPAPPVNKRAIRTKKRIIFQESESEIDNQIESESNPELIENFAYLGDALKKKLQRNWTHYPTK